MPRVCLGYGYTRILLFMMLAFGTIGTWGQTDYSGYYYIGSVGYNVTTPSTNYYLCPTEGWCYYKPTDNYDGNGITYPNPFLTTYKCKNGSYSASKAEWIIEKAPSSDYYYIRQRITGKYLVSNGKINTTSNPDRIRVHLESIADPTSLGDKVLFDISPYSTYLVIRPMGINDGPELDHTTTDNTTHSDHRWLTVNGGNTDYLKGVSGKTGGPSGYVNTKGVICLYTKGDNNGKFYLEDILSSPVITQQVNNTIKITYPGEESVTLYYTTDGSKPNPENVGGNNPTQEYNDAFPLTESTTIIKAIAVKAKDTGEVLDTYSRVTTLNVIIRFGIDHPYFVQSQDNANYYMIPVTDTNSAGGFTKTHTTTLGQPSMMWYFKNAGNVNGIQYYYMVNKTTGQYVYYHLNGSSNLISIDSSETFDETENKDKYCFSINSATGGGFNICPKIAANLCIYKGTSNKHNSYILAYTGKANALGRWNFISVPDEKMPAVSSPVTVSTPEGAIFYSIENVRTPGNYISPDTYVTTSTSVTENEKWYFLQADKDDWLTYYYIVNAVSGEYLYLNKTGTNAVITKTWSEGLADEDKYQFVLAPSSTEACFIIPKTQAKQETRVFTGLYSDATAPLKTEARRYWVDNNDSEVNARGDDAYIRWIFNEVSLTSCHNPVFEEKDGNIILSCKTYGSEIRYTTDGTTPTVATGTVFTDETELPASNQYLIKAIAVQKNNTAIISEVVTLFNKPDVTLAPGPYVYKADFWEPAVTLSIGETTVTTGFTTGYSNNKDAGTASVAITNSDPIGTLYFLNVPLTEFTIDQKALDITANNFSIEYGDEPTNDDVTYNGFAGSETETVLSGELTYTYNYARYDHVSDETHSYTITPGGLTSTNYDIKYVSGILTVNRKSIGDGTLASGFSISFDEDNNIILRDDAADRTLALSTDYTIGSESTSGKYSTRAVTGAGNYTGSFSFKNAIVHFTTDADQEEWSATFAAENTDEFDIGIGLALPEGVSAFIISEIQGEWAIPEPLNYIPEGVPVLLVAHKQINGFVATRAESGNVTPTQITDVQKAKNMLEEVTEDTPGYDSDSESVHFETKQIYVLYKNEFVFNKAGNMKKGKIYLNPNHIAPSTGSAPARLKIAWNHTTGIQIIKDESVVKMQDDIWYTIDGRRLSGKPNAKGLYIVDGKKIVIK